MVDIKLAEVGLLLQIDAKKYLGLKIISISASSEFRNQLIKEWEDKEGQKYDVLMGMFYWLGIPLIEAEHLPDGFILHVSNGSQEFMHQ
jgi:hypothetical protein